MLVTNSESLSLGEGLKWIYNSFALYFEPKVKRSIDEWVTQEPFYLPSNTSEPGRYTLDRAPYQKAILEALSPNNPSRFVILVFGSQMGKTTIENIAMCYYIRENPVPIGFAFSDVENLKNYVKHKFDPMLIANPSIKATLKSDSKTSADSLASKEFPGGFLKFLSGKSEASMRSDSFCVVFADELDAMGITKGGDVRSLLMRRQSTFNETAKLCMSSTPTNDSVICTYLEESTNNKYFMKCPHCKEYMSFELDYLKWKTIGDGIVTSAWMECPNCFHKILNEDKLDMMSPESGAMWIATNTNADPINVGFYLPSFYAPVGWISWKDIAQEYVTAAFTSKGVDHERMTAFYNTILAQPYKIGSTAAQDWRILYEKSLLSEYTRNHIPEWVNCITTGTDVQQNRFEISVYGWGMLGHSIAIEHIVIPIDEYELEDPNSRAWQKYDEVALLYKWAREDGLELVSIANGIDSSYKPDLIYAHYARLEPEVKERLFPLKGKDNLKSFLSTKHFVKSESLTDAAYWDVPVSSLKHHLFDHLKETTKDNALSTIPFYMEFPRDYSQEYYQQLYSEVYVKKNKKWIWEKIRDRNEILDCTIYNLAMFYHIGLGNLTKEDWEGLAISQKEYLNTYQEKPMLNTRAVSKGFEL